MLELRQQLKLAQKLVMTPQLRQAIKLLQLNRLELTNALRAELEQNPLLEETPEMEMSQADGAHEAEPGAPAKEADFTDRVQLEKGTTLAEINWADYANSFDSDFSFAHETPPADAPSQFDFISSTPGLHAHLRWQLMHLGLDAECMDVAEFIIGNLDGHGFLQVDLPEIMAGTGCDEELAEWVLESVQKLDPPGIGARNVQESLLLQLDRLGLEDSLAGRILRDHLPTLETRNYTKLARETETTPAKVAEAVAVITGLTPYPGNEYSNEAINYVVPDVYVFKVDEEFIIQLNEDGLPHLRLSPEYHAMLKERKSLPAESLSYLREKKRDAEWFIKSIQQRQRTIYKVMESLLKFQHDFFEQGPSGLRPLILRDVAEDIEMHESTVSRVTTNKYVHTPQGIFELKYFFSTAILSDSGESVAAASIKDRIRQLIGAENPAKPLSDSAISDLLVKEDMNVARRTVAKYREQLKILPIKLRRKPA